MYKLSANKQRGFLIIALITLLLLVTIVGVGLVYSSINSALTGGNVKAHQQATQIAQAGIEAAMYQLAQNNLTCNGNWQSTVSEGGGQYRYQCTNYFPTATTLSSGITAGSTVIPLSSNTGYAPIGTVLIDYELIAYRGTSTNTGVCGGASFCLTNVLRGIKTSTANSHSGGTSVKQSYVLITSEGAIPNIASPRGRNVLYQAYNPVSEFHFLGFGGNVLAGDDGGITFLNTFSDRLFGSDFTAGSLGFAVGRNGITIFFNGQAWENETNITAGNVSLNAVKCANISACWAVGGSGRIYLFNGSAWSLHSSFSNNLTFGSVDCTAPNNCWAGGELTGGGKGSRFYRYNGTSWSEIASFANRSIIHGLACISTNDCWAVGEDGLIYRYTGSWTIHTTFGGRSFFGLACPSSNNCWATADKGRLYRYNGSTWSLHTTLGGGSGDLYGVACKDNNDCFAVDEKNGSVAYYWNGSTWTNVGLGGNYRLFTVAANSPTLSVWTSQAP